MRLVRTDLAKVQSCVIIAGKQWNEDHHLQSTITSASATFLPSSKLRRLRWSAYNDEAAENSLIRIAVKTRNNC
jgi:hypothetical protein